MHINLLTVLLISLSGTTRPVLASPIITGDGDDRAHALDEWINQSTDTVSVSDNPNKNSGDDCTVVNSEGANIPGKVSYPRDCTTLSVWKNSFEEDGNALVNNPDSCRPFSFFIFFLLRNIRPVSTRFFCDNQNSDKTTLQKQLQCCVSIPCYVGPSPRGYCINAQTKTCAAGVIVP